MGLMGLKDGTPETDMVPTFFGLRGIKLNWAIGFAASAGFLLFGYDQGVLGSLYTLPSWNSQFPSINTSGKDATSNAAVLQGLVTGVYELGCFVGAISMLYLGNLLGRRANIWIGSIIMAIGTIGCTASYSLAQLFVFRVILGIGNGMHTATIPVWQSECSPPHKRGMLIMVEGAMITGGIAMAYWIDFGCFFLDPSSAAWRLPIALQLILILPTFVTIYLPESPRWLVLKGREEDARQVVAALDNIPVDDPMVGKKLREIAASLEAAKTTKISDIFTNGPERNFHRTVLGFISQMFQQISGINLITYYIGKTLQEQLGFSDINSRILAAANGTEYFIASWAAVFFIEKMGRRPLMLGGAAGQCVCMIILAIMDAPSVKNSGTAPGVVSVVFYFLFNTSFAWGWLGMTWLYPAEITPLAIRAQANGISTSANWLFNFMVVMVTPVMFQNITYNTYTTFAVLNFVILIVTYFIFPETAGRSLEEMSAIFSHSSKINPYDIVRKEKITPRRYDKQGHLISDDVDIVGDHSNDLEKNLSGEHKRGDRTNLATEDATATPSSEGSSGEHFPRRP
ncbi:probable sugar transporter [Melanopsichium pennsylvanicum]|uniref:Probable sugar transporter n=2 Tax=Melanopsichium pennsylvanicum TaxID=63383 RepID=A0AAJ5C490_9BASI|nr:probable sugar transporter [Melanopsichium pennsylvanicum 4]SNX83234.1 probable sugar transporter [Melanopsichium pennsylvanicum]